MCPTPQNISKSRAQLSPVAPNCLAFSIGDTAMIDCPLILFLPSCDGPGCLGLTTYYCRAHPTNGSDCFSSKPLKNDLCFIQDRHPTKSPKLIFLTMFLGLVTAHHVVFLVGAKGVNYQKVPFFLSYTSPWCVRILFGLLRSALCALCAVTRHDLHV